MKITYDQKEDAVVIRLTSEQIIESEETKSGIIVDFDANGKIVALEFLNATRQFSPDTIKQFQQAA